MFMILAHHFVVHNGYDVKNLSLGPERIFFQLVMQGDGKVGVVIFFTISAWFFLDMNRPSNRTSNAYGFWNARCCFGALLSWHSFWFSTVLTSV